MFTATTNQSKGIGWKHNVLLTLKRFGNNADREEVSSCGTRDKSDESIVFDQLQWSMLVRYPPWLWNSEQISPIVKNRGSVAAQKRTDVLKNLPANQWLLFPPFTFLGNKFTYEWNVLKMNMQRIYRFRIVLVSRTCTSILRLSLAKVFALGIT